jgi:hypothetical protein
MEDLCFLDFSGFFGNAFARQRGSTIMASGQSQWRTS